MKFVLFARYTHFNVVVVPHCLDNFYKVREIFCSLFFCCPLLLFHSLSISLTLIRSSDIFQVRRILTLYFFTSICFENNNKWKMIEISPKRFYLLQLLFRTIILKLMRSPKIGVKGEVKNWFSSSSSSNIWTVINCNLWMTGEDPSFVYCLDHPNHDSTPFEDSSIFLREKFNVLIFWSIFPFHKTRKFCWSFHTLNVVRHLMAALSCCCCCCCCCCYCFCCCCCWKVSHCVKIKCLHF